MFCLLKHKILLINISVLIKLLVIFVVILLFPNYTEAAVKIIPAIGSYVMGDGETESVYNAKKQARLEAIRRASEQAGVYLESFSKVENYQLSKDEIVVLSASILSIKNEEYSTEQNGNSIRFICNIIAEIDTESIEQTLKERIKASGIENRGGDGSNDQQAEKIANLYKRNQEVEEKLAILEKKLEEKHNSENQTKSENSMVAKEDVDDLLLGSINNSAKIGNISIGSKKTRFDNSFYEEMKSKKWELEKNNDVYTLKNGPMVMQVAFFNNKVFDVAIKKCYTDNAQIVFNSISDKIKKICTKTQISDDGNAVQGRIEDAIDIKAVIKKDEIILVKSDVYGGKVLSASEYRNYLIMKKSSWYAVFIDENDLAFYARQKLDLY